MTLPGKYRLSVYGKWQKETATILAERFGNRCWYCGIDLKDRPQIDHIEPKKSGGSNKLDNLALSCARCNSAKRDSNVGDFLKWLSRLRSSQFECFILGTLPKSVIDEVGDIEWDRLQKDWEE